MTAAGAGSRPFASVSLDLDDAWAYLRTRGDADWADSESVLPQAVERLLPVLAELELRITVFVVGRDAERPAGREAVRALADAGHEIASHSFLHRGDLAVLPQAVIEEDLHRAADAIESVTGQRPLGFRCPSFGRSPALLDLLGSSGYAYDASLLPTSLAPLLNAYYRTRMRSAASERPHADLFGPASSAVLPLSPFRWDTGGAGLLELPVSTVPVLRTPMHMSYLQALSGVSPPVAGGYLRAALWALRARELPASFLLHPTDVLDARDAPRLGFFPGMAQPWEDKVDRVRSALAAIRRDRDVVPMGEVARRLEGVELPVRTVARQRPRRRTDAAA